MEKWLTSVPKNKPFFAFLFLRFSTFRLSFRKQKNLPSSNLTGKKSTKSSFQTIFDRTPYFNRYKNSVFFTDKNLGRALSFLGKNIDIDKTIIVITSDHGEEFNDTGKNYWGHNGNFTKYQAQIPFIVKWPGKASIDIGYRTSALDVSAHSAASSPWMQESCV